MKDEVHGEDELLRRITVDPKIFGGHDVRKGRSRDDVREREGTARDQDRLDPPRHT